MVDLFKEKYLYKRRKNTGLVSGIVFSAGYLSYYHGEDTLAAELLKSVGIGSIKELIASGAENSDIQTVRTVFERAK